MGNVDKSALWIFVPGALVFLALFLSSALVAGLLVLVFIPFWLFISWLGNTPARSWQEHGLVFASGALVALPVALIGELIISGIFNLDGDGLVLLSGVVPVVEEGLKLGLAFWLWRSGRIAVRNTLDGVWLVLMVSLGFSIVEDIGYASIDGVLAAVLRFSTSPAHLMFDVLFAFVFGSRVALKPIDIPMRISREWRLMLAAMFALALHGLWNGSTVAFDGPNQKLAAFYIGALLLTWLGLLVKMTLLRRKRNREYALLTNSLNHLEKQSLCKAKDIGLLTPAYRTSLVNRLAHRQMGVAYVEPSKQVAMTNPERVQQQLRPTQRLWSSAPPVVIDPRWMTNPERPQGVSTAALNLDEKP